MKALFTTLGLLALATAGCELIDDLIPPGGGSPPGGGHTTPPHPPHACTAIGCNDQLNITMTPGRGGFPAGLHTVTVLIPGEAARTCEFVLAASTGTTAPVAKCSPGLRTNIFQKQRCMTVQSGQSVGQSCEPVPGELYEQIVVEGTPAKLRLTQRVGGTTLFDGDLSPAYVETRPNGPMCEPVCKQASSAIQLSAIATP